MCTYVTIALFTGRAHVCAHKLPLLFLLVCAHVCVHMLLLLYLLVSAHVYAHMLLLLF